MLASWILSSGLDVAMDAIPRNLRTEIMSLALMPWLRQTPLPLSVRCLQNHPSDAKTPPTPKKKTHEPWSTIIVWEPPLPLCRSAQTEYEKGTTRPTRRCGGRAWAHALVMTAFLWFSSYGYVDRQWCGVLGGRRSWNDLRRWCVTVTRHPSPGVVWWVWSVFYTGDELGFNLLIDGQEKTIEVNPSSHTYASIMPSNDGLDLPPNMLRR